MSLDTMKKVLDAEGAARKASQDAAAQAGQIIQDAETAGRARLSSAEAEARTAVKAMMAEAEMKASGEREEILRHGENQCAVLRARAESKLSEATALILERIVTA